MSAIASTRPGCAILTPSDHALMPIDHHSQMPFATHSIDATTLRNNVALVAHATTSDSRTVHPNEPAQMSLKVTNLPMEDTMRNTKRWTAGIFALATTMALVLQPIGGVGQAQAQDTSQKPRVEGISRQPTQAASEALFDPNDAVLLLLDHQTGLFQTVKDVPVSVLRANTVALAKIAEQAGMPIIYTASEPDGTNGPIMEELPAAAPNAQYVGRQGEVSSWDNADFVEAVEATGRKTLIIAGVWTSVCVAFPALQAKADGYEVYAVMDASGDVSKMASDAALARMTAAGIVPVTTNTILSETHRTWNRPDAPQWGELYAELVPEYQSVVESYARAQKVAAPVKDEENVSGQ